MQLRRKGMVDRVKTKSYKAKANDSCEHATNATLAAQDKGYHNESLKLQ